MSRQRRHRRTPMATTADPVITVVDPTAVPPTAVPPAAPTLEDLAQALDAAHADHASKRLALASANVALTAAQTDETVSHTALTDAIAALVAAATAEGND